MLGTHAVDIQSIHVRHKFLNFTHKNKLAKQYNKDKCYTAGTNSLLYYSTYMYYTIKSGFSVVTIPSLPINVYSD